MAQGQLARSIFVTFEDINTTVKIQYYFVFEKNAVPKLMKRFSEVIGVQQCDLRFLHDGKRINVEDTPLGLAMESGDTIEVFREQIGGRARV